MDEDPISRSIIEVECHGKLKQLLPGDNFDRVDAEGGHEVEEPDE